MIFLVLFRGRNVFFVEPIVKAQNTKVLLNLYRQPYDATTWLLVAELMTGRDVFCEVRRFERQLFPWGINWARICGCIWSHLFTWLIFANYKHMHLRCETDGEEQQQVETVMLHLQWCKWCLGKSSRSSSGMVSSQTFRLPQPRATRTCTHSKPFYHTKCATWPYGSAARLYIYTHLFFLLLLRPWCAASWTTTTK